MGCQVIVKGQNNNTKTMTEDLKKKRNVHKKTNSPPFFALILCNNSYRDRSAF